MLVLAKIIAFWIVLSFFNIAWSINFDSQSFLGMYPILKNSDLIAFVTTTDVIFVSIMIVGLIYYLFVAKYLHNTHVSPRVIAKLAKYNMLFLIKDNFKLYHEIVMWFIFTWIANVLVLANSFTGKTMIGVPTFSILFTAFLTVVFIKDACLELENKNK